jgi:hypothetical protein
MSKKKIFLLFSGELRFYKENILSIKNYLRDYDLFYFFFPWESEKEKINFFKENYKNSKFDLIIQNDWQNLVDQVKYPDNANNNTINLFYMWDALTQCFNKTLTNLEENDLVLRFRSDIKINSDKIKLNLNNINYNTLYIPDCYHWNGVNDQFFFTKVKTLKKFSNFFEFLNISIKNNDFICPEYTFYKFLKKTRIKKVFFPIDYQIMRKQKSSYIQKKTIIPITDHLIIKYLKISYKLRNLKSFYWEKNRRNKRQNLYLK